MKVPATISRAVLQALETYLALLSVRPSLLAGYDREKDVSARQNKEM